MRSHGLPAQAQYGSNFVKFSDLIFHERMPDHFQAKWNGYSIIRGQYVQGFEIMDLEGEVHPGLTAQGVEDFLNARK
jgi:hypothetical protein